MVRQHRTRHGGNSQARNEAEGSAFGSSTARESLTTPAIAKVVSPVGPSDLEKRECLKCGLLVPLRKDGLLRAHRVGKDRRNSWPCPGGATYRETPTSQDLE